MKKNQLGFIGMLWKFAWAKTWVMILTFFSFSLAVHAEAPPEFTASWGNEGGVLHNPSGIATDASNNIYVADTYSHRIQKFTSGGVPLDQFLIQDSGEGEYIYPHGVAVDFNGNIYVAQYNYMLYADIWGAMPWYFHSIQKYDSSGNFLSEWAMGEDFYAHNFGIAADASGNVYVADTFNNLIQKFNGDGMLLTEWGTSVIGYGEGEFFYPEGIAVDVSGNVYVADTSNDRIQKFDSAGNFLALWGTEGTGEGQFKSPVGIAADANGNVYVSDNLNYRIQKFTSDGSFIAQWGTSGSGEGAFDYPEGIAVDATGKVYVADSRNNRVQKFDSTGTFIAQWGNRSNDAGHFYSEPRFTNDASGNLYVADTNNHRILKFDGSGNLLTQWGTEGSGNGQFSFPWGIKMDAGGNIYVIDSGNSRLQKFNSSGSFLSQLKLVDPTTGQFWTPTDISFDGNGYLYASDSSNHRILKYDNSGNFLIQWGTYGSDAGQFWGPVDIATDTEGNVYVADLRNFRIQKFDSVGTYLTQWGTWGHEAGQFYLYHLGLATDAEDNVYVADNGNHRIQKFSSSGVFLGEWGSIGSDEGQFILPTTISTDTQGGVYVYDSGNYRIQKFTYLAPAQPTSLTASAASTTGINLNWTDASDNESGFIVERCQGAGCSIFAVIATVGANTTSYGDAGLTGGTSYSYRVRATNNGSKSAYSNIATTTTLTATPPAAPKTLTAIMGSGNQVNLSWSDQSTNETGFKIERCTGSTCSNFSQIATVGQNVISWTDTTVTSGSTYRYRVRAYNSTGNSVYSNIVTITVTASLPAAPSNLTAIAQSATQIKLTWTDNASNETQFKIERCQGSTCSNFVQIRTVGANSTSYTDNNLRSKTAYRYRVRASNSGGNSAYSNSAGAITK